MNDLRSYFSLGKRLSSVFNGSAVPLLLLAGCIVAVIGTSEVRAQGCADGTTFIGAWRSMTQTGTSTPSHLREFSFGLQVVDGEGAVYECEIFSREVVNGAVVGDWSLQFAPIRVPASSYFLWCMQLSTGGADGCRVNSWLSWNDALYDHAAGWDYSISVAWLKLDDDGDSIINLDDPDALIACSGDIFEPGSCPLPQGADIGWNDAELVYVEDGAVVGAPYSTGSVSDGYACDGTLAYGGTAITEYAGLAYASIFGQWAKKYWRGLDMFGDPGVPKPYEGAYSLVRGGSGGGETAYFSACWGKKVSYILTGATLNTGSTSAGTNMRYGDYKWHRYVVVDERWYFQWWSGSCWKSIGVWVDSVSSGGSFVKPYIPYGGQNAWPTQLVPVGYLPGDVLGETYSNTPSGLLTIPGSQWNGLQTLYGGQYDVSNPDLSPLGGGSGSSSGDSGLSASDLETAFGNALRAAGGLGGGGSGALDGVASGEGATTAAAGVFGMQGVGDGGVSGGIEDGLEGQQAELGAGLTESLGLDAVTPGTDIEGVFDFEFQVPGYGSYTASLSTLPDTSTAWGVVFEGFRLLVRLGISTWWTIVLAFKLIGMYKEIT